MDDNAKAEIRDACSRIMAVLDGGSDKPDDSKTPAKSPAPKSSALDDFAKNLTSDL